MRSIFFTGEREELLRLVCSRGSHLFKGRERLERTDFREKARFDFFPWWYQLMSAIRHCNQKIWLLVHRMGAQLMVYSASKKHMILFAKKI